MTCRFELLVANLEASVAFYSSVLGFTVRQAGHRHASLEQDGVVVGLSRPDPALAAGARGLGVEIVLEVDDVAGFRSRILTHGGRLDQDLRAAPGGLVDFRLADPDGYRLRITSRLAGSIAR